MNINKTDRSESASLLEQQSQVRPIIGYLGPEYTNSHGAALRLLALLGVEPTAVELKPFMGLPLLLEACELGEVAAIVAPYENALEGTVIDVLDAMSNKARGFVVHAELTQPILHGLLTATPQIALPQVTTVYSHPMALGQCRLQLRQLFGTGVSLMPTLSTTEAVERVLQLPPEAQATAAAIAPPSTAERYQAYCHIQNVSDVAENETRFLLMSQQRTLPSML
jgi:prephenate dehydratase